MTTLDLAGRKRSVRPRLLSWFVPRFVVLGLLAAGTGCGGDPCAGLLESCLVLDVRGDVGRVDSLRFDSEGAIVQGYAIMPPGQRLPVLEGMFLGVVSGAVTVHATALLGGNIVGYGRQEVNVPAGGHPRVRLNLARATGSCTDGIRQVNESDVDCGGSCPTQCQDFQGCRSGNDCVSAVCTGTQCAPATCTDAIRNGSETDVDCGGACPKCVDGQFCQTPADCASGVCNGGRCMASG